MDIATLHPPDRQEVGEGAPHPVPGCVFRYAKLPCAVGDRDLDHSEPLYLHQGWHKAVHPLIHFEILETLPPVDPEGAAAVPNRFATETVPDVVSDL